MNEEREDAAGIGRAIALALPRQQRRSFSVFSLTQLPSTLDRTSPCSFPLPRPSIAALLHPFRPPIYGKPCFLPSSRPTPSLFSLSSSGRNTAAVTTAVIATVIALYRRYMYAVHPCPLPLSVTQRVCLPEGSL